MLKRLKEIIKDLCEKWGCEYVEGDGEPDHFHLVFRYFPQTQLAKFIGNLKSVSSRRMNEEYSDHLKKTYYPRVSRRTGGKTAKVFWNESYSIDSVGVTKLDILLRYVRSQPRELLDRISRGDQLESG